MCKELHAKIDKADEERYDAAGKVTKGAKEVILLTYLKENVFAKDWPKNNVCIVSLG